MGGFMKGKTGAILIDDKDNVAVALDTMSKGTVVSIEVRGHVERIRLISDIPKGHKFALRDMETGTAIVKYGQPVGQSTAPVARGEHIHVHNVTSRPRGGKR
jgi:altronate dehydratase small subunit